MTQQLCDVSGSLKGPDVSGVLVLSDLGQFLRCVLVAWIFPDVSVGVGLYRAVMKKRNGTP